MKKGARRPLFADYSVTSTLLVVDVHGDFKAKANVAVFRSFPFHDYISSCVKVNDYRHKAGHLFTRYTSDKAFSVPNTSI